MGTRQQNGNYHPGLLENARALQDLLEKSLSSHNNSKIFTRISCKEAFKALAMEISQQPQFEIFFIPGIRFLMRKYTTDFYARKRQLLALIKKNEEFLIELNEVARIEKVDEENRKELNAREEFSKLAKNLHHLSSTAVQPGIYKPPYSQIPKAFDIDIETHLKVAFQTTNRAKTAKASNGGFRIRPNSQRVER